MSWLRIEDSFTENAKISSLSDPEFRVWVRTLCFCARRRSGLIQRAALKEVPGLTMRRIDRFLEVGLLDKSLLSWAIHDWSDYQPTDFTAAERMARHRSKAGTETIKNHRRPPQLVTPTDRNNGVTKPYPPSRPVRTEEQKPVVEAVDNQIDKPATTSFNIKELP